MNTQQAALARDTGMALAVDKADREREGWSDDALNVVRRFVEFHDGLPFLTETVRLYAQTLELIETPSNERAWGAVMRRAAKEGYIKKVGYAPSASSNLSPKTLWQAINQLKKAA